MIIRSTDGGDTWSETSLDKMSPQVSRIYGIYFISPAQGWATGMLKGGGSVLLKTMDGGNNWTISKLAAKQLPICIHFVDANKGFIGGYTSTTEGDIDIDGGPSDILATTDGGQTWNSQRHVSSSITQIFFVDQERGWATGYKGVIYSTVDGGKTWTQQHTGLEAPEGTAGMTSMGTKFIINSIFFNDPLKGWASACSEIGSEGRILGTTDGGQTWSILQTYQGQEPRHIYFISKDEGFVSFINSQYVYHTIDGGSNWTAEPLDFSQMTSLYEIATGKNNTLWAVGGGGIFKRVSE